MLAKTLFELTKPIQPNPCLIKGKRLDTCYSAAYMSQTRHQQRFTISELASGWHETMVPQRIMWPSIARTNGQLDHGAASRHAIAPISHTIAFTP